MNGYIIVKDNTKSFWKTFLKFLNSEKFDEDKVTFQPYQSKTQVSYTYKRNLKTQKFPPISIEIFLNGTISDNFYAIIKVPKLTFDQWAPMHYCWEKRCWKLILDFDINNDIRLSDKDHQVSVLISTA